MIPTPLAAMAAYPQWILWMSVALPNGKTNKLPVNPHTGEVGSAHDSTIWVDAETAYTLAASSELGVGFVFTAADPFFFVDIDHCLVNNTWSPLALEILGQFPGAAVEISQSGEGLHIFGTGAVPESHRNKRSDLGLEFYSKERFVALGGQPGMSGDSGMDCTAGVNWMLNGYLAGESFSRAKPEDWTDFPSPDWDGFTDDGELVAAMLSSQSAGSAFGTKASVSDLWTGNVERLAHFFPDDYGSRDYDASSADAALLAHLAFWTGRDCARMERLFGMSALADREKWQKRGDYRFRSIGGAAARCRDVHKKSKRDMAPVTAPLAAANTPVAAESGGAAAAPLVALQPGAAPVADGSAVATVRQGYQFLGVNEQLEYFKGCVYVSDVHRVLCPDGTLLQPDRFKSTYGGYVFAIDSDAATTSRNAFEALVETQALRHPKVHSTCFRPELTPGIIVNEEGVDLVNTYVPAPVRRVVGDPVPFISHMRRLLPVTRDREILLSYMAACVQHIGVKFQWSPLLQGCEGNGKSLVMRVVAEALGHRYSHFPNAQDLGNKFNAWIQGVLFVGIEELHVKGRQEIADALKPLITNDRIEIQAKGGDQVTGDNRANFIMNSQHRDAVMKTKDDRRYAVFFTAQQKAEDLGRDGMNGEYFPQLYNWLKYQDGYAIVAEYLHTYQIPAELNPAGSCHRAPATSSTSAAIEASMGSIEQEIVEAAREGRMGFCGGWISSMALDRLLQNMRAGRILPPNKRREALETLGYVPHAALVDGRATRMIGIDGGKPRLFVKADTIVANITDAKQAMDTYEKAQAGLPVAMPEAGVR